MNDCESYRKLRRLAGLRTRELGLSVDARVTRLKSLVASFVLFFAIALAFADGPLTPPTRWEVSSPSGSFVATLDPRFGIKVRTARSQRLIWGSSNWFRAGFLADDGEHFVSEYDGLNLIPQDYKKDIALLTFWHRDQKIREVTLAELFPDASALRKTVSHYDWGSITGITNTELVVTRCDGKVVRFNATTGELLK